MPEIPAVGVALLVVDVQPTFLKAMQDGEGCLRRCRLAVSAAQLLGVPVFFTEQVPDKLGPTHPDLLHAAGAGRAVFGKTAFSAFGAPGLVEALGKMQVSQLLVCGLEVPVCVYQTAMDGLREGMGITILADAVEARRPEDSCTCFEALRAAGVHILPTETVFYAMLGAAAHPQFRAYTALVKQAAQA
jgi:nicotinamidase-related amidase